MSCIMPKRRLEPLPSHNWSTFCGKSVGDFNDNHRKDGAVDKEKEPCDPLGAQTVPDDDRHRDDSRCPADNSHTIDGEHPSAAVAEPPSNRISKPIQRSLESASVAATSPTISVHKKIVKHNLLQNNAIACELDKSAVNRSAKADESAPKSSSKGGKSSQKLKMRTNEDTKCFFEAICEHGKDFPRIESYMAQRCEKKGIPQDQIKNYEQVRHYYYRMWHKIANSIAPKEVVDKNIQEIYGLINYGEIWKKFGTKFDNNLSISLQQLVNFGHTTFKVKKGRIRVKTPIFADNIDQNLLNLPKEVCIELHSANNESWRRLQSLSQYNKGRTTIFDRATHPSYITNDIVVGAVWPPSFIDDRLCFSAVDERPAFRDSLAIQLLPADVPNPIR
ncbi:unnamed protein product [Medioppia subpectinata]|uniref:Uncharacterized protein n=1 Tax=Medioppia subpectinata TaxID=1979941 RepID=A0A7R9KH96_9ACAR|nr:unnamed protein product [Medioppia subpectinata]CAG2102316.1 unnamed protein product [Medioppia subpectinata]